VSGNAPWGAIEGPIAYRQLSTVVEVRSKEIVVIRAGAIAHDEIMRVAAEAGATAPQYLVPGFAGELTEGRDLLGIWEDASAIAVLLASATLDPPLALALYGDWGSGKSFFMRTLEYRTQRLTESSPAGFCRRIASVWFNAWHYTEGNLWASLLHHIFYELHGGDEAASSHALNEALAKVHSVQQAKTDAAQTAAAAEESVRTARERLRQLQDTYDDAKESAAKIGARDVWNAVKVDADLRDDVNAVARQIGLAEAGPSARELNQAVEAIRDTVRHGRALATAGPFWRSPLVLGLLVGVVVSVAGLVLSAVPDWSRTWLAPAVAAVTQLAAIAGGGAAWLTRQNGLMRAILSPADRLQRQILAKVALAEEAYRRDRAVADQHLREAEARLAVAAQAIADAEAQETVARLELEQLTGGRLLERYLAERARSGDYRQYLGVVALAHRDLRDLSRHLQAAFTRPGGSGEPPVDRIVLYIDDLDRCPPELVVQVLESVNLLLALPLFVVVVGVDPRWLRRSLRSRNPLLLGSSGGDDDVRQPTAADYLDKIFQLSYHLPEMDAARCAGLLQYAALNTTPRIEPSAPSVPAVEPLDELITGDTSLDAPAPPSSRRRRERYPIPAAALSFDDAEMDDLRIVASLVGTSPRRAKRFLNAYRLAKTRGWMDPHLRDSLARPDRHALRGLLVLVALLIGLPRCAAGAAQTLEAPQPQSPNTLGTWLSTVVADSTDQGRLDAFAADAVPWADVPIAAIAQWLPIARRFAWPLNANGANT
jgi:hypothetical protein